MLVTPRFSPGLVFALLASIAPAGLRAQLATTSPFLPPQAANTSFGPTVGAPLEFRGIVNTPADGLKVRIYDPNPNRKTGAWLKINERDPNYDFVVKQYDASRDTVTVEYHGQTLVLAQREAKVTSSGAAAPNLAMVQIPPPPPPGGPVPGGAAPTSQSQLEAVAAAVAQRRALREQATQTVTPGVPVAPQVNPPTPPQNQNGPPRGPRAGGGGGAGARRGGG